MKPEIPKCLDCQEEFLRLLACPIDAQSPIRHPYFYLFLNNIKKIILNFLKIPEETFFMKYFIYCHIWFPMTYFQSAMLLSIFDLDQFLYYV